MECGATDARRGVVSSRGIERLCREHVTFIALSGDSAPHFKTIAAFVSRLFAQVLFLCDRQGLIGRQMFAIDGVKLPSNGSKAKSGSRKTGHKSRLSAVTGASPVGVRFNPHRIGTPKTKMARSIRAISSFRIPTKREGQCVIDFLKTASGSPC